MAIYSLGERRPQVHETAFVADSADLIGRVILGVGTSVWFGAVLRGDNEPIHIGDGSNVQEGSVLHTDPGSPVHIGRNVTIGHQAMLHGCTIGDESLIGIQAVVLDGARIGKHCLVGAGALVTQGKVFEDGQLILGSPAKAVRALNEKEIAGLRASAEHYTERSAMYKRDLKTV